jgi:hypothetical protein
MVAQFRVREVDRETEVQTNFLHLFGDFLNRPFRAR